MREERPFDPPSVFFLLHHALCVWGLAGPLVTGQDSRIVIVGFIVSAVAALPYCAMRTRPLHR